MSNSWLIYKWGKLGNKKNSFSTFCAYKAWWRTEWREYTKVIMSPLFSNEKLPRFLVQRDTTPRLNVHVVSECAFTASKSFPQKKVIFFPVSLSLVAMFIHQCLSPTEPSSVVSWDPSWRVSPNNKRAQIQMYCATVHAAVSSRGVGPMRFHVWM